MMTEQHTPTPDSQESQPQPFDRDALAAKNRRVMAICLTCVAVMVSVSFAAVPLYNLFCSVTGFGGTTQVSDAVLDEDAATGRTIKVRFNADTDPHLPWNFKPEQTEIEIEIGRSAMAYYTAENRTARPVTGMAVYNVTPLKAGKYFHKVQCFCFNQQTLAAGENVDMPVLFFVDPSILEDRKMSDVETITLSYTFFEADNEDDLQDKVDGFYEVSKAKGAMVGEHVGGAAE